MIIDFDPWARLPRHVQEREMESRFGLLMARDAREKRERIVVPDGEGRQAWFKSESGRGEQPWMKLAARWEWIGPGPCPVWIPEKLEVRVTLPTRTPRGSYAESFAKTQLHSFLVVVAPSHEERAALEDVAQGASGWPVWEQAWDMYYRDQGVLALAVEARRVLEDVHEELRRMRAAGVGVGVRLDWAMRRVRVLWGELPARVPEHMGTVGGMRVMLDEVVELLGELGSRGYGDLRAVARACAWADARLAVGVSRVARAEGMR